MQALELQQETKDEQETEEQALELQMTDTVSRTTNKIYFTNWWMQSGMINEFEKSSDYRFQSNLNQEYAAALLEDCIHRKAGVRVELHPELRYLGIQERVLN